MSRFTSERLTIAEYSPLSPPTPPQASNYSISMYSSAEHSESEGGRQQSNGGETAEQRFQKKTATIGSSIQKIQQNVTTMQRMVNQIGTAQDTPDLKSQLYV